MPWTDFTWTNVRSLTAWDNQKGQVKEYPGDFAGFANEAKIYRCPARNKRVIISNGIPDHQVTLQNKKGPCVINWAVEVRFSMVYNHRRRRLSKKKTIFQFTDAQIYSIDSTEPNYSYF